VFAPVLRATESGGAEGVKVCRSTMWHSEEKGSGAKQPRKGNASALPKRQRRAVSPVARLRGACLYGATNRRFAQEMRARRRVRRDEVAAEEKCSRLC